MRCQSRVYTENAMMVRGIAENWAVIERVTLMGTEDVQGGDYSQAWMRIVYERCTCVLFNLNFIDRSLVCRSKVHSRLTKKHRHILMSGTMSSLLISNSPKDTILKQNQSR